MNIERKKKELEYKRVQLGVDELEFKVIERLEDIKRIEDNIRISKEKLEMLKQELEEIKE